MKKSNGYLLKGIRERVELISRLSKEHSIKLLCKVLKVARSTYYSILNHKASSREIENNILKSKIFKIYCDNRKVYGCIKITRILREDGYPKLSVNRVSRLMKQLGIRSITIRKFKNYRNKQNEHSELKNLVNQNFSAQKPNQIWLSDITYIHTVKNGWTYLASVLDVCTRKIVGYSYGRKMDRSLVISALTNSWQNQNYPNNVILHSDRGSQYTSSEYIAAAVRMGFRLSYSKKGCPFDNAPMESFHSVLKKEEVYLKHYSSFHEANIRLFDYINGFYNRNRIHSVINFLSPIQFENSLFFSYFFSPFCVQIIDYGPKNSFWWRWTYEYCFRKGQYHCQDPKRGRFRANYRLCQI
ncbi:MAG: IS3 family transposase [Oscillospiraceae bacterium]